MAEIRKYRSRHCSLDEDHEVVEIQGLEWPCYDVFSCSKGVKGEFALDISKENLPSVVDDMKKGPVDFIGVSQVGINPTDARLIADFGVGVH